MKRLTVNPAPADLRKAAPPYDPPIATGLLLASEQAQSCVECALFLGEPRVDGALRHTWRWLIRLRSFCATLRSTSRKQGKSKVRGSSRHLGSRCQHGLVYGVPTTCAFVAFVVFVPFVVKTTTLHMPWSRTWCG